MSQKMLGGEEGPVVGLTEIVGGPAQKLNLRRLETIQRLLQYGAALVLVVFLALIAFSWFQLRGINRQIDDKRAELQSAYEILQAKRKEIDELQARNGSLQKLNGVLADATRSIGKENPEQANEIKRTVEESIKQTDEASQVPPRVYIQISREDQRKRAGEMARQLEAKGYVVPGIENVEKKARVQPVSEIRYYQSDATAQRDVKDIGTILDGAGVKLGPSQLLKNPGNVRPRLYELWFGTDF